MTSTLAATAAESESLPHRRVLTVDGNSLAHRAWHALNGEQLDGPWVAHGIIGMIATAQERVGADRLAVAFDDTDNRRRELDESYKAHRDRKPDEFYSQLGTAREVLAGAGVPVTVEAGWEADDVLAAAARSADALATPLTILSSDKDLMALASDYVTMLRIRRSASDLVAYDPARVAEEFAIPEGTYRQFAALRGDPSDGIAGVTGIGPKAASKILTTYGSVDAAYAAVTDGDTRLAAGVRKKLVAGIDDYRRSLALMTPADEVTFDLERLADFDADAAVERWSELGLRAASRRFARAWSGDAPPENAPASNEPSWDDDTSF